MLCFIGFLLRRERVELAKVKNGARTRIGMAREDFA